MKFLIGKYETKSQSFVKYEERDFTSISQAKKWCQETDTEGYVYMVVRGIFNG